MGSALAILFIIIACCIWLILRYPFVLLLLIPIAIVYCVILYREQQSRQEHERILHHNEQRRRAQELQAQEDARARELRQNQLFRQCAQLAAELPSLVVGVVDARAQGTSITAYVNGQYSAYQARKVTKEIADLLELVVSVFGEIDGFRSGTVDLFDDTGMRLAHSWNGQISNS